MPAPGHDAAHRPPQDGVADAPEPVGSEPTKEPMTAHALAAREQPARTQPGVRTLLRSVPTQALWLLAPLLAIPALLPFYTEGLTRSYDGGLHLLRIGLLDRYLRQGMLFPRWAPELLLGHGYPVFSFYAPAAYYLVEALHLLGLDLYTAFILAFVLLILGAGWGMYLLARDSFGANRPGAALVAAVAYLYAPYLLTNVYIRGAIAEAAAQTLLPWIFWSTRRLLYAERPARYLLPVVFSLAGLALTHNITLLFVPPVLLGYSAVIWWQSSRRKGNLLWMGGALLLAMGVSSFFWLPLALERRYLADTAYEIARTIWLPGSVWTGENFLDRGWTFTHTFARPIRLGLVQLILAVAGFLLGLRRSAEWMYWGVVALLTGGMISTWALPLWLNSDILNVAQFTWRLLSILSLPLALFAGAIVWRLRPAWIAGLATAALLALILWSHAPRLQWMDVFAPEGVDLSLPVFLQLEVDKDIIEGGAANSSLQEFRPRWAAETLALEPLDEPAAALAVTLLRAHAFGLEASVTTTATTPLRFNDYYFPGWQVQLDGQADLQPYPSTNLGLLTVDVPPGTHTVRLTWHGTAVQRWSGWLALAALAVLAGLVGSQPGWRLAALIPLTCLAFGLAATFYRPALGEVQEPAQPVASDGLRLLGYRTQLQADGIELHPYWQVTAAPPDAVRARWQLQDLNGRVRVDLVSYPYFNSYRASDFPTNGLVDDAYLLPLPQGLAPGSYWLALALGESHDDLRSKPVIIGQVEIPERVPLQPSPQQSAHMIAGNQIQLLGFDLERSQRRLSALRRQPSVVRAGDYLRYRLYWQAIRPVTKNYHGFVHLIDLHGRPLVQEDQLPGPFFHPPLLWNSYRYQTDTYLLRIPPNATGGLYWPAVGLYDFATLERLPLFVDETGDLGYDYRLPPIKVVGPAHKQPAQALTVQVGDFARLVGYDLPVLASTVRVGEALTLTLYYQSERTTPGDYTRFVHLYDAQGNLVTQSDSPPQGGVNPTWSWVRGETVVDPVTVQLPPEAAPGAYTLYTGLYNPADGVRVPLTVDGQPLPDNRINLATVTVSP
jgi:hypothetical protein